MDFFSLGEERNFLPMNTSVLKSNFIHELTWNPLKELIALTKRHLLLNLHISF